MFKGYKYGQVNPVLPPKESLEVWKTERIKLKRSQPKNNSKP
jgi:hypothetical protein